MWGPGLIKPLRETLGLLARTISGFEPVTVLVRESELQLARHHCGDRVDLLVVPLDDCWIRDSGAVFVVGTDSAAAVDFNFNGWGNKQSHIHDSKVAGFMADHAGQKRLNTDLVLEGGGIEVDGEGTAIIAESCVLNPNRNPGLNKATCEFELKRLLGIEKVIWLPGIAGRDITDGHTDFYARFAQPGVVVAAIDDDPGSFDHNVTRRHLKILESSLDARGRQLNITRLETPHSIRRRFDNNDFAAGYINFYVFNGAVILPEFGDRRRDNDARDKLKDHFPGREIIALNIDPIAAGGEGIHCVTQQQPEFSLTG